MLKGTVEKAILDILCHHQIAIEKERGRDAYIVKGQEDQSKEIVFHLYDID
jgi:hypothetical protein